MRKIKTEVFTLRLTPKDKKKLEEKAGGFSSSAVVRELIRMWINGEIEIKV